MAVAKRRAIDRFRRDATAGRILGQLGRDLESGDTYEPDFSSFDEDVGDDLLRLIFIACHPVLSTEARVALTLRLLGGLTTAEIARAFLATEPAIAQRIVRAKRTLSAARVPFEMPVSSERAARLGSVLEVVYLVFNEGYSATAGDDVMRPALIEEALRLGRVLAELLRDQSEVHGLVALMEIQASRSKARLGPSGEPVLLLDQDRGRWDRILITRGLRSLARAEARGAALGPYALQAAIAACHAARERTRGDRLARASPRCTTRSRNSPRRRSLNSIARSPSAWPSARQPALELADALAGEPALQRYHLLPSVRGDLLERLDRFSEASEEFERAASLAQNSRDRTLLLARAAKCRR